MFFVFVFVLWFLCFSSLFFLCVFFWVYVGGVVVFFLFFGVCLVWGAVLVYFCGWWVFVVFWSLFSCGKLGECASAIFCSVGMFFSVLVCPVFLVR